MTRFFVISIAISLTLLVACGQSSQNHAEQELITPDALNIEGRFPAPEGLVRVEADSNSFTHYLRTLPLKPHGENVRLFNGREKSPDGVYCAVIDLPIGTKDLHQCADAVIRLRAEYLWNNKRYAEIHFDFTNGFRADYSQWMLGKRVVVNGNHCSWVAKAAASNTHDDLWNYLETVFMYAGTRSLEKELTPANWQDMQPGDVLIQGGSPGHAVIVVDMVVNEASGEKRFLLAQSYMPAQEIQILVNPDQPEISPWYRLDATDVVKTPEWTFKTTNLKRFNPVSDH